MSSETPEREQIHFVAYRDVEVRFTQPIACVVRPTMAGDSFVCVLADAALATRLRDRLNNGRGTTPAGARTSLERKLLRLVLSTRCPRILASLVEYVGPREHVSRTPVTDMLRLAVLAQWLCVEERRCRAYTEVTLRQEPTYFPSPTASCYRLDLMFLEQPRADGQRVRVTGIEVKSSRADFSSDHKWQGYIGRVDRLYIATLPGVVREGELPDGVGLLELRREPATDGFFDRVRPAYDEDVSEVARFDLLYALACTDRWTTCGLELQQRALHAVDTHWRDAKPRRARRKASAETV